MSRLKTLLQRGHAVAQRFALEPVTYARGASDVAINAIRAEKQTDEVDAGQGAQLEATRVDWLIPADQVEQTAGPIAPIAGDKITDADSVQYMVVKDPVDGKVARWSEHRLHLRVHTVVHQGE